MDNFIEAFKIMLDNYANFNGRASKSEFWYAILAVCFIEFSITVLLFAVSQMSPPPSPTLANILSFISMIILFGLFIPSIALFTRRVHDTGHSGLFVFLMFIPLVRLIALIFFGIKKGDAGDNKYGAPSKNLSPNFNQDQQKAG